MSCCLKSGSGVRRVVRIVEQLKSSSSSTGVVECVAVLVDVAYAVLEFFFAKFMFPNGSNS